MQFLVADLPFRRRNLKVGSESLQFAIVLPFELCLKRCKFLVVLMLDRVLEPFANPRLCQPDQCGRKYAACDQRCQNRKSVGHDGSGISFSGTMPQNGCGRDVAWVSEVRFRELLCGLHFFLNQHSEGDLNDQCNGHET